MTGMGILTATEYWATEGQDCVVILLWPLSFQDCRVEEIRMYLLVDSSDGYGRILTATEYCSGRLKSRIRWSYYYSHCHLRTIRCHMVPKSMCSRPRPAGKADTRNINIREGGYSGK